MACDNSRHEQEPDTQEGLPGGDSASPSQLERRNHNDGGCDAVAGRVQAAAVPTSPTGRKVSVLGGEQNETP